MKKNKSFEFKPFSKKQKQLLFWWKDGSPYKDCDIVIADGSIRSGKTIACIVSFLQFSQSTFNGEAFIIAGKTIGALKKNVIKPMLQILEAWGWEYNYNRSENYIEIGNNVYYMYDASNEASQDKLQGLTAAGAYADEVALFPRSFVDQMIARCSVENKKIFLNCNPGNPNHYVNQEFILKAKEKNILHLHFTMDDNLSLSAKVKEMFYRMFTGVFFKRYVLGLWAVTDGLVYQQFADEKEKYIISEIPEIVYAIVGVDFGGTKSGHAFTLTGYTQGFKKMITLEEYYKKEKISPAQLEQDFVDFIRRCKDKYKIYTVYCDSAEQTLIRGLEIAALKNHLGIEIKNAIKGQINDRIAFLNSMIAQDRYFISDKCPVTIQALEQSVYDDKQITKDVRLDNGTNNQDSIDSLEYSFEVMMNDIMYIGG